MVFFQYHGEHKLSAMKKNILKEPSNKKNQYLEKNKSYVFFVFFFLSNTSFICYKINLSFLKLLN